MPQELIGDLVWSSIAYDWLKGEVGFLDGDYRMILSNKLVNDEYNQVKLLVGE